MAELRPYQQRGIQDLRRLFGQGLKRVVMYLPTGGGKSVVAESIIRLATDKGKRVGFLCNRIQLVNQIAARFERSGIPFGVLQGDNSHGHDAPVMACSIQTLARRKLQPFDLLIIDEAHAVAGSAAYRKLLFAMNNVPVVGLTATPFAKAMAKPYAELGGPLFQGLAVGATIKELIADGFLVDVDIYAPEAFQPDLSNVRIVAGDYDEKQLGDVVDRPALIGDIVRHWFKHGRGKPTIVFAANIAHSKHITEQFRSAGVKAEHIDCYTPEDEREAILERVRRGETTVISNAALLAEGLDIPQLEVMILARPTRSLTRYIQQAGRILRPSPGKTRALILDHSGTCIRLGFPTDDLPLELDHGKPKKSGQSEKREKLPSVCPSCGALKASGEHACPLCGFAPEKRSGIEPGDGELKPLSRKERDGLDLAAKQAIYSALIGYAASLGKNPNWAYHLYREYMGTNPASKLEKLPGPMVECVAGWLKHRRIRYAKAKEEAKLACTCGSLDVRLVKVCGNADRAVCGNCQRQWWLSSERKAA